MLSERVHRVATRYPAAADAALGLVIGAASFLTVSFGPDGQPQPTPTDGGDLIVAAIIVVAVAIRRRWPWPSLALGTAGAAAFSIFGTGQPILLAAIAVAVYTIAVRDSRRTAWLSRPAAPSPPASGPTAASKCAPSGRTGFFRVGPDDR